MMATTESDLLTALFVALLCGFSMLLLNLNTNRASRGKTASYVVMWVCFAAALGVAARIFIELWSS